MIKKVILFIAVFLMSAQIFAASAQVATESSKVSGNITKKVVKVIAAIKKVEPEKMDSIYDTVHVLIRKAAHFTEYAILSFLVYLLAKCYNLTTGLCFVISLGYGLVFAIFDEIHQLYVPGRSGELRDVIIDFCGSVAGGIVAYLFAFVSEKMRKKSNIF